MKKIKIIPKCKERGCGKVLSPEDQPFRICSEHFPPHSSPSCVAGFCSCPEEEGEVDG